MYKHLYSRFLDAHPSQLHFASHSHHYWPDVTRDAHLQYWDDSCQFVDNKWNYFFEKKIPRAQKKIADTLKLPANSEIIFAPNTHELVFRLLSSLDWSKKNRVLTTDSEFYSFDRQINRLKELPAFEVEKVPTHPLNTFQERFSKRLKEENWDFVFVSQVFFNSGAAFDVEKFVDVAPKNAIFVIDGYHGFMALPTDLSRIADRAFYLSGSYKYAQGGEGACFLSIPPSTRHRPLNTGWFAELAQLTAVGSEVPYPQNALQYAGSTMDFSGLYRLLAVFDLFEKENINVPLIHSWVQKNQKLFLAELTKRQLPHLHMGNLVVQDLNFHGHFLTFELSSTEETKNYVKTLNDRGLWTDSRGTRLRFGFGLYQSESDIQKAVSLL